MKNIKIIISILLLTYLGISSVFSQAETYTVTKNTDPDPYIHKYHFTDSLCDTVMYGTFQWAIRKANDDGTESFIEFNIAGGGTQTIALNYELPAITEGNTTVDATTQPGYNNEPLIVLDGQNIINRGIVVYGYGAEYHTIKGLHIKNFRSRGILMQYSFFYKIEDNIITSITNTSPDIKGIGIRILGDPKDQWINGTIQNNYIGTNIALDSTIGCEFYGISIDRYANKNFIYNNTIAYNEETGIYIVTANQNKISQNRIFGQTKAIDLIENANDNKQAPDSLNFDKATSTLSGIAEAGDTIEIFGSTGSENANEYIATVNADASGNWSANINPVSNYFVATATDNYNNTSILSDTILVDPFYLEYNFHDYVQEYYDPTDSAEGGLSNRIKRMNLIWGPRLGSRGNIKIAANSLNEYFRNFHTTSSPSFLVTTPLQV